MNFSLANKSRNAAIPGPLVGKGKPPEPTAVNGIHQFFGNRVAQRLSAPLRVNAPGDLHEQQADQAAAAINTNRPVPSLSPAAGSTLQTARDSGTPNAHGLSNHIASRLGGGAPLPAQTRRFMESGFGRNFSDVRIHTDATSHQLNQRLNAHAFTTGRDIFFSRGGFQPESSAGRHLLAHELAHVVQQRGAPVLSIQRQSKRGFLDRISDNYKNEITASPQFAGLTADEQTLVQSIITAIEALSSASFRVFRMGDLQSLFLRGTSAKDREAAQKNILDLGLDKKKLKALFDSLNRPFLGYTASGYDFSQRFFKQSGKLGFQVENSALNSFQPGGDDAPYNLGQPDTITDPANTSFEKSDILFFSGHQYAQYKVPGQFTNDTSDSCFNISMLKKSNKRVKLVASTSCATICKDVAAIWRSRFPDALILGYRFSAPLDGSKVADSFTKKLQSKGKIDLSDAAGLDVVRQAWKDAVIAEGSLSGGPALLYKDEVEFYEKGKWIKKPWDDKANECHYH